MPTPTRYTAMHEFYDADKPSYSIILPADKPYEVVKTEVVFETYNRHRGTQVQIFKHYVRRV